MNTVEIKLVINGKEAIATLELTDENVQKMATHLNELGQKGANSVDLIRQRYAALVALMENVPLGSKEFEELSVMTMNARKELDQAEAMMQKTAGTTGNARVAVTAFSQTLSDSTQFQNGFRYGMMAISNNLEQMFGALGRVKAESQATGQTMVKSLAGALSGPGGVMIGLSSVMVLLQVLPGLLEEDGQKVEDFSAENIIGAKVAGNYADALRDIDKALKGMDVREATNKLVELNVAYQESTKVLQAEKAKRDLLVKEMQRPTSGSNAGLSVAVFMANRDVAAAEKANKFHKDAVDSANNLISSYSRIKLLQDEIAALQENYKWKTTDVAFNTAEIAKREREISEIKKTQSERLEEQAAVTIRLQRAQVDAMQEGYEKQKAAANAAFEEVKASLEKELREKSNFQSQYTELLKAEEQKRNNALESIEADRQAKSIDLRADALRRMAQMDSSDVTSKLALDERLALSKATTEEERLRITKEFAIKRVEAEADAQMAIIEIERQAILAKLKNAPVGSKEREGLMNSLDANDDALQAVFRMVQQKKTQITFGFNIDSGAVAGIEAIAGMERKLAEDQQELARATTDEQREAIRQRIQDHKAALAQMAYSEEDYRRDLYSGMQALYSQVSQLISQSIQQDADAKLRDLESTYRLRDERIQSEREVALQKLQAEQDSVTAEASSSAQKTAINKSYADRRKVIEKQYADAAIVLENQKEAEARRIKLEAFNAQKNLSYVTATINIAEGITRIMATIPPPFNIPLIALTAATGAIQLATIASSKPGFKDGGVFSEDGMVRGPGGPREDRVNAYLSDGEFVVNARSTSRYIELLKAINDGGPVSMMAAGGRYERLRSSEQKSMVRIPSLQPRFAEAHSPYTIDLSKLETKIDEVIDTIKGKEFSAYLNRKILTEEIELQQRLNEKGRF